MSHSSVNILPDSLINVIAAGEVIERPSSVVKELVENALDAGSSRITVRIEDGGRRHIQVSDDGMGMSEQDALLAIERHATSKISTVDDLIDIKTMGFRGEALPSIASVGRFVLKTWDGLSESGTCIRINNGTLSRVEPCGRPRGTSVSLSRIFGTLPARKKYMKSRDTEMSWCLRTVEEIALTRPDIHFEVTDDSGTALVYPAVTSMKERIAALWGADEVHRLLELKGEKEGINIKGYISPPGDTYTRRSRHHVMVNGRTVRDPGINRVISSALSMSYPHGRYPALVLSILLPPGGVDVNVHPSKKEVRIERFSLLTSALKEAVNNLGTRTSATRYALHQAPQSDITQMAADSLHEELDQPAVSTSTLPYTAASVDNLSLPIEEGERVIGQYMGTYILLQSGFDLLLVDQHAAHERIVFNNLMSSRMENRTISQPLMLPIVIELASSEIKSLLGKVDLLETFGLGLEEFGTGEVRITAIPPEIPSELVHTFIRTLASDLGEMEDHPEEIALLISRWACKSSITAGRRLTEEEMVTLVDDLRHAEAGFACPHGRPTIVSIALEDIEKLFGRR
jgi:DNA mismatch repair protein MutL